MKKSIAFILTILMIFQVKIFSQKKDTIVNNNVYEAFYSYDIAQPRRIIYKLYNGGGNCDNKEKFIFRRDSVIRKPSSNSDDYKGTEYNMVQLANADDFGYDCNLQEKTFRYYNCIAMTPELYNGEWKLNEIKIRELSKEDSLIILCGGVFLKVTEKIKEGSKLIVPKYCYKVVISLTNHKVIQCTLFDNNKEPKATELPLIEMEYKTRFFFDKVLGFTVKP